MSPYVVVDPLWLGVWASDSIDSYATRVDTLRSLGDDGISFLLAADTFEILASASSMPLMDVLRSLEMRGVAPIINADTAFVAAMKYLNEVGTLESMTGVRDASLVWEQSTPSSTAMSSTVYVCCYKLAYAGMRAIMLSCMVGQGVYEVGGCADLTEFTDGNYTGSSISFWIRLLVAASRIDALLAISPEDMIVEEGCAALCAALRIATLAKSLSVNVACPNVDVRLTDKFVSNAERHEFWSDETRVRKVLATLSDAILGMNDRDAHEVRSSKGGGSEAVRIQGLTLWRRDIDTDYHIHYTRSVEGHLSLYDFNMHEF